MLKVSPTISVGNVDINTSHSWSCCNVFLLLTVNHSLCLEYVSFTLTLFLFIYKQSKALFIRPKVSTEIWFRSLLRSSCISKVTPTNCHALSRSCVSNIGLPYLSTQTIFCPLARVNALARVTLPPCKTGPKSPVSNCSFRVFKFSRCPAQVTGYFKHLRRVLFVLLQ